MFLVENTYMKMNKEKSLPHFSEVFRVKSGKTIDHEIYSIPEKIFFIHI